MKTLLSNEWLQRDFGFLYWVVDACRCKRLLVSVVVTFMGEAVPHLFPLILCFLCCLCYVSCYHSFFGCRCSYIMYSFSGFFLNFQCAALDSDDLLYLKEQMEAEEDAERLLRRTEKRAFAAFKRAASLADSSPASVPLAFRVEPKPKSGIRQQDLLKKVVEIKPKRPRTDGNQSPASSNVSVTNRKPEHHNENERPSSGLKKVEEQSLSGLQKVEERPSSASCKAEEKPKNANTAGGGLLGLAYASSDDDDEE
ncbi:uncharacterized protein LOC107644651 isoform X2 [Arachis ipaensis]|uniref:uncharacterized protein LOC107644651 isoform X2 n=1 Tax=Arachis ipaensis TaxID=130454 RepID=UPI0007AF7C67|nr:uncharacterized protein LOC107644651 isoform X2 [Arachis ipaensis]XP_025656527.1 uncharacterized protein LOC112751569 isoform X2 [Arachis hypogaea]